MRTIIIGSNGHHVADSKTQAKKQGYNMRGVEYTAHKGDRVEISGKEYVLSQDSVIIDNR